MPKKSRQYNPPKKFMNPTHKLIWGLLKTRTQAEVAHKMRMTQGGISLWKRGLADARNNNFQRLQQLWDKL